MPDGYLPQNTNESSTEVTETMFHYTWDKGYRPDDFMHLPNATVTFICNRGTKFEDSYGYWSKTVSVTCGAEAKKCEYLRRTF